MKFSVTSESIIALRFFSLILMLIQSFMSWSFIWDFSSFFSLSLIEKASHFLTSSWIILISVSFVIEWSTHCSTAQSFISENTSDHITLICLKDFWFIYKTLRVCIFLSALYILLWLFFILSRVVIVLSHRFIQTLLNILYFCVFALLFTVRSVTGLQWDWHLIDNF